MPSDKARLYLALYVRGGEPKMPGQEDKYHWALLVGSKNEQDDQGGTRYHAKNVPGQSGWIFEERQTSMTATNMVLVRVLIGKVADPDGLANKLRSVAVVNNDSNWNCVYWVKDALAMLENERKIMGTCKLDWKSVRDAAMAYCQKKKDQGRFDGTGDFDSSQVPTFSLLERREITP